MKIINLNNWALINNSASVSLPHLHAKFDILTKKRTDCGFFSLYLYFLGCTNKYICNDIFK